MKQSNWSRNNEIAADAAAIARRLRDIRVDETIPYSELNKLIGKDVQGGARSALSSARKRIEQELRTRILTVRGIGLTRLTNEGSIHETVDDGYKRVGRIARRTTRRLKNQDDTGVSQGTLHTKYAALSMAQTLASVTKAPARKVLEDAIRVRGSLSPIGPASALEAIKSTL